MNRIGVRAAQTCAAPDEARPGLRRSPDRGATRCANWRCSQLSWRRWQWYRSQPRHVTEASVLVISRGRLGRSCTCDTMASSSTTVASLESIVRSSRGTSGTSATVVFHPCSDMSHGSSQDTSGASARAVWCSSSATATSCSGSVMCRSSIIASATGHHHRGQFFGFDQRRKFRPWHDRRLAWEGRHELPGPSQSMPDSHGGKGGGRHGGAPPEDLLKQLEDMGFRHVPELLRSRDPLKIASVRAPQSHATAC
jgi:hypothetical protein